MNVHYSDLVFKRPDILKYLALPFGYRFFMENNEVEILLMNTNNSCRS
ncbi:immunity protein Imm33 domain-containing protein [Chryseobacterium arthrosphaerae]